MIENMRKEEDYGKRAPRSPANGPRWEEGYTIAIGGSNVKPARTEARRKAGRQTEKARGVAFGCMVPVASDKFSFYGPGADHNDSRSGPASHVLCGRGATLDLGTHRARRT